MTGLVVWRTDEKPEEGGRPPRCWLSVGWGRERDNGQGVVFKTLFRVSAEEARNLLGLEVREFPREPVRVTLKVDIWGEG